jgi:hypothetical protein
MLRVAVRSVEALVGAVAAGALLAKQVNLWNPRTTIPLWVALAIVTLQAVGMPVRAAISHFRAVRSTEFREAARTALSTALMRLNALPGIELRDVGLNAFMVQREVDPPWRRHLHRVAKVRLSHLPGPSHIFWTKGKGVIGQCWAEENIVVGQTGPAWAPYLEYNSKAQWKTVPEALRLNLSFKEFRRIRGKYEEIVAVPIVDANVRFRGCVAVDLRLGAAPGLLMTQDVQEIAQEAATTIGNYLAFVSRWVYTAS